MHRTVCGENEHRCKNEYGGSVLEQPLDSALEA